MNNPLKPLLIAAALAAAAAAGAPVAQAADSCPNATIRAQQSSTDLPGCRAYEMVSAIDKNGGDATSVLTSSPDGDRLAYFSMVGFADADATSVVNSYAAVRDPVVGRRSRCSRRSGLRISP